MSQIILAERCNWCSRQQNPNDLLHLSTRQKMCRRCYEWHRHALEVLAGRVEPLGCQFCGLRLADLNALSNGPTTRMYMVPVDGIYAVACFVCKEDYCRKRADLYHGTAYGQEIKV